MTRRPGAKIYRHTEPFRLEYGDTLHGIEIAYETYGRLNDEKSNAILVCPAFSAHSHVRSHADDPSAGWWEQMVGPGCAFDSDRWFVVCASLLGSCYGTTGPTSIAPDSGLPYAGKFPSVCVRDMVNAHLCLADHLGIKKFHAVAGGSLGAMQAVELGIHHPTRIDRVIAVSGTDRTRPYTAAIRHIGRRAIMLDPRYKHGAYGAEPPVDGIRLARELGTLFYRSREEFNERFEWPPIHTPRREGVTFDVQSYLDHQGKKVVEHFDANAYLTLSLAMDLHDVTRGYASVEAAYAHACGRFLIVGVPEDRLIPVDEQRGIHDSLIAAGKNSTWHNLTSPIGHDAFLVEVELLTPLFTDFLLAK